MYDFVLNLQESICSFRSPALPSLSRGAQCGIRKEKDAKEEVSVALTESSRNNVTTEDCRPRCGSGERPRRRDDRSR
jgi:hypothetical protein